MKYISMYFARISRVSFPASANQKLRDGYAGILNEFTEWPDRIWSSGGSRIACQKVSRLNPKF